MGHPITYSTGLVPSKKPVDPRPHVIVENLPDYDEIDDELVSFMNKTTNSSIASCEIKNGTGYLYYHNPDGTYACICTLLEVSHIKITQNTLVQGILSIMARREFFHFYIFLMHIHVLMLCRKFELILIKIGFFMNF